MGWTRGQYIATVWFFLALTLILVCIRLYVRLTTVYRPWRELLVIFAWLSYLTQAIATTLSYYHIDMRSVIMNDPVPLDWHVTYAYKMTFTSFFCVTNGLNACKAVLLLTCLDICHRNVFPKIWLSLIVTFVILIIMEFGVALIYVFLQCLPKQLAIYWSAREVCDNGTYRVVLWTTNLATDIIISIVPLILVSQLKSLTRAKKIGVTAMFAIGFVNVLAVIINFMVFLIAHLGFPRHWTPLKGWNGQGLTQFSIVLVLPTAIIVVCVPQLRILGRWKFGRKVAVSVYKSLGGTYDDESTLGRPESTQRESTYMNMELKDEENQIRWSAPNMVSVAKPSPVLPRIYSVSSSGTARSNS